jgi:hypothetical protein
VDGYEVKTIRDAVSAVVNYEDAQIEVGTLDITITTYNSIDWRTVVIFIRNRSTNQDTTRIVYENDIALSFSPSKLIEDEITSMRSELVDKHFMKNTLNWG